MSRNNHTFSKKRKRDRIEERIGPEISEMNLEESKLITQALDQDEGGEDEDKYETEDNEEEEEEEEQKDGECIGEKEKKEIEPSFLPPKDVVTNLRKSTNRLANWIEALKKSELLYITEKPFNYQLNAMREFYENRQETFAPQAITFSIATGVGKTFLFGSLAIITREKTLIVCPSNILCDQTIDRLTQYAKKNNPQEDKTSFTIRKIKRNPTKEALIKLFSSSNCVVTTYAMLVKHLEKVPWSIIDSVVLDEAHRSFSEKRSKMVKTIMSNQCNVYAYTATPNNRKIKRGKGSVTSCEELLNYPKNIISSLNFKEAIKIGANVPIVTALIQIEGIELKLEQKNTDREISEIQAGNQLNQLEQQKKDIYAAIVDVYMNGGDNDNDEGKKIWHRGQQCICFCPGIASAQKLAQRFIEKITNLDLVDPDGSLRKNYEKNRKKTTLGKFCIAKSVNSALDKRESKQIITQYRAGGILILTGADMLIEGFDNPQTSIVINLRPTKSEIIKIQSCGRGFRKDKDDHIKREKICYIYDLYWGNTDCLYFFQYLETERHQYQFHWGDVNARKKRLLENKRDLYQKFRRTPITEIEDKIKIIRTPEQASMIIRGLKTKSDKSYKKNSLNVSMFSDYQHEIGLYSPISKEFKSVFDEIENLDQSLKMINEKFSGNELYVQNFTHSSEDKKISEIASKKPRQNRELILTYTDIQERLINQSSSVKTLLEDMFSISQKNDNENKYTSKNASKNLTSKSIDIRPLERILKKYQDLIKIITDQFECLSGLTNISNDNDQSENDLEKLRNIIKNLSYNLLIHRKDIIKKLHQDKIDLWIKKHNKYPLTKIIEDFCLYCINKKGEAEFEKNHAISVKNIKLIRGIIKSLAHADFKELICYNDMNSQDDYSQGSQDELSEDSKQDSKPIYEFPALITYISTFRDRHFQYKLEILEDLLSVIPDHIPLDCIHDHYGYKGTPLHALIREFKTVIDIDFFFVLLHRMNDINCVDKNLNSCLHSAAHEENKLEWPTAQLLLLAMKADPNLKNNEIKTPALISQNSPCRAMYSKPARGISTCDQNGRNILHHILKNDNSNYHIVKKIIDAKVDVNARDNKKLTPIMYIPTINRKNINVIQLLLEKKADINSYNNNNETHLHLLFKNFYDETNDIGSNYLARNNLALNPSERVLLLSQFINNNSNYNLTNSNLMTPLEIIYQQFNQLFDLLKPQPFKNRSKIKNLIDCFFAIENLNVIPNNVQSTTLKKLLNTIDSLNMEFKPLISDTRQDDIDMPENKLSIPVSELKPNLEDQKQNEDKYYRSIEFTSSLALPTLPIVKFPDKALAEIKRHHQSIADDNDNLIHIGQWGEYLIYNKLRQHYRDKYQGNIIEFFPPRALTNIEARQYSGFKGFKLAGIQKRDSRRLKVSISVEWLNMWPKECDHLTERKNYEKFKNIDMLITKTRAYDIFLLARLPADDVLKAHVNTYIFVFSTLHSSVKLYYINKKADSREKTEINSFVILSVVCQYIQMRGESWQGLVEDQNTKMKLMQQISSDSDGKTIKKERYVEIKSTSWLSKHATIFKKNQCEAMREYKEKYCIYRVFGVPNIDEAETENPVDKPKIDKIKNPYKKIRDEQLNFSSITLEI